MSKEHIFTIGENKIKVILNREQANGFLNKVSDQLYAKNKYVIQSNVEPFIFQSFISHYTKLKLITDNELVNIDYIYQYYFLIKELGINIDLISNPKYTEILKKSIIKNSSKIVKTDIIFLEQFISENLDFYLDNYSKEMQQLPIQLLKNIFTKQKELNHEKVYNFITFQNDSKPKELYSLLSLLDCFKLTPEIVKECILKKEEHLEFFPKNYYQFIENIMNENSQMKQIISKLAGEMNCQNYYQFNINNETDEGILHFLVKNSDKFDPNFIASVSSNDIYNLLVRKEKKTDKGFMQYCNNNDKNWPKNSSFSIELKNEVICSYIEIYGSDNSPLSFSYQINDMAPVDVSVEEAMILRDKDEKKRVFTIHLNPPKLLSKITLTPKDPTTKNAKWYLFGGIELFSPDQNLKEVFQTLIENSKYKDPHRCGVYARAVKYCTNYFHSFQKKGFEHTLLTLNEKNSFFKIELTKGVALIDGFRLQKCKFHLLVNYKIVATDDLNKNENEWPVIYVGKDEKDLILIKHFDEFIKIKAIKIIQTGTSLCDDNKTDHNDLKIFHFDISGLYFPY